jgi:hypothetical protein
MEVRLCKEGSERVLVDEFCRKVFAASGTEEKLQIKTRNPYAKGYPPTAIAIHKGSIVGHLTSTPHALWLNGKERPAYWLSGLHVLPEARGMGAAKALDACLAQELPLLSGVFVIEAALRTHKASNWVFPGKIAEYVHIIKPEPFLSLMTGDRIDRFVPPSMKSTADIALRMLRKPIGLGIRSFNRLLRIPPKARRGEDCSFVDVTEFGPDVDELWEKTKKTFSLTHVRNAEYMNWQFPTSEGWKKMVSTGSMGARAWVLYTIMTYKDGGPLDGLKSLNIIDALWWHTEPDIIEDLVRHVLLRGYEDGVDIIMFSGNHPRLRRVLRGFAFIRIPSTVYVGFRSQDGEDDFDELYTRSYITRGYADAAGGLGPQ